MIEDSQLGGHILILLLGIMIRLLSFQLKPFSLLEWIACIFGRRIQERFTSLLSKMVLSMLFKETKDKAQPIQVFHISLMMLKLLQQIEQKYPLNLFRTEIGY